MATAPGGPPRWLERLTAFLAPDTPAGRAALGDLHERWDDRRRKRGAIGASLWYVCEGLALGPYRWRGLLLPLRAFATDLRLAGRSLRRRPILTAALLLTLVPALVAAGTGATLVWATLLRPLPHPEPDRLVVVEHRWDPFGNTGISTPLYRLYRERARSFEEVGIVSQTELNALFPDGTTQRLSAAYVTAATLELLGARPLVGRLLTEEEDRTGSAPVVLLTHELWTEAFGGDPSAVGGTVDVEGVGRTIVGVLDEDLEFVEGQPSIVLPAGVDPTDSAWLNMWWWYVVGRLAPDSDAVDAQRELDALMRRAVAEESDGRTTVATLDANGIAPVVTPLLEWQTERARDFVLALAGAVALLLALAVASSATLLIGRAESRTQELRVRRALGAGGRRLTLHLLADPVVLCLLAATAALPVAWMATQVLQGASALELPRLEAVPLPVGAASTVVIIALLLIPLFGLVALGQVAAARAAPTSVRIGAWAGLRRALLGTQVAVAVVLLTAMLVLGSSVRALAEASLGFQPDGVLTFSLSVPDRDYPEDQAARALHRAVLTDVRALPGVVAAGFGGGLPVPAAPWGGAMAEIEGYIPPGGVDPTVRWTEVSEGFVDALGVSVLIGRPLVERDMDDAAEVLVVNEAFADAYLGGSEAAVGRRIRRSGTTAWFQVVGVVESTADHGPGTEAEPVVFAPEHTAPPWNVRWGIYAVRTSSPAAALLPSVREIVRSLDPALPVFDVMTMRERVRATTARERLALQGVLLAGLGSIVVVVASLAGLILLSLLRRRREIGVRKAVGATDDRLRWLLVRGALVPAAAGLAAGAAAVAGGARVPSSLLHGAIEAPSALAGAGGLITVLVVATGVAASLRVSRVQASEALRAE